MKSDIRFYLTFMAMALVTIAIGVPGFFISLKYVEFCARVIGF